MAPSVVNELQAIETMRRGDCEIARLDIVGRGVATGGIYPPNQSTLTFMWLFCLLDPFIPAQIKFLATPLIVGPVCQGWTMTDHLRAGVSTFSDYFNRQISGMSGFTKKKRNLQFLDEIWTKLENLLNFFLPH